MNEQDYEQLTLFPVDSPVNHSALQGNSAERTMTVISGQRCSALLKNFNPLGCLAKMLLESSIWHSTRCLLTWKLAATPHRRLLFRLVPSTHRTGATGSQFWPTPTTQEWEHPNMELTDTGRRKTGKSSHSINLADTVLLFPTPKASSPLGGCSGARKTLQKMKDAGLITEQERRAFASGSGGKLNPEFVEWLMGYERHFTEDLIPTPTASASKGATPNRWYSQSVQVERERGTHIPEQTRRTCGTHAAWENWPCEPELDRVVDGIPNRVDRVRCLGNAVVPQQFFPFFDAIYKISYADKG